MFNGIYSYNAERKRKMEKKGAIRRETKEADKKKFAQWENPANFINISLWQFIQHVIDIVELIRNKLHDWGCRISLNRYLKYSYCIYTHTRSSNILCTIYSGLIMFRLVVYRTKIKWVFFSINRKRHCFTLSHPRTVELARILVAIGIQSVQ